MECSLHEVELIPVLKLSKTYTYWQSVHKPKRKFATQTESLIFNNVKRICKSSFDKKNIEILGEVIYGTRGPLFLQSTIAFTQTGAMWTWTPFAELVLYCLLSTIFFFQNLNTICIYHSWSSTISNLLKSQKPYAFKQYCQINAKVISA